MLSVCFWNGDPLRQAKIAKLADSIAALTPVKFNWGAPGAFVSCPAIGYKAYQIRVSLEAKQALLDDGDNSVDYFSSIGRMLLSSTRLANVNLPFPPGATDALIREKTLHEFCHVLGCLHEHQRGLCDNDFNKAWIQAHYGYNEEQYAANFIRIPSSDGYYGAVAFGLFDDTSIMLYTIPEEAFSNKTSRCFRKNPVVKLSSTDEAGLRNAYLSKADPLLQKVDDFARLAALYDQAATTKRIEAAVLKRSTSTWIGSTPLLRHSSRYQALLDFDKMTTSINREADGAANVADSYRLTPDTTEKLKALMALLPED